MKYNVVIIGGGIVGLATAMKLKEKNPALKIALVEKEKTLAAHQTGHNSGVIHSGIYYKPGSLKATNCIKGYNDLLDFCRKEDIAHKLCGKVIVATDKNELPAMDNIYKRGLENGLTGLKRLQEKELKEYEPHVNGIAGIFVPQTGIIDYKQVSEKYAEVFRRAQGEIFLNEKVIDIRTSDSAYEVVTENKTFTTQLVINCAGLFSDRIASLTRKDLNVRIIPFRGEYYELRPKSTIL